VAISMTASKGAEATSDHAVPAPRPTGRAAERLVSGLRTLNDVAALRSRTRHEALRGALDAGSEYFGMECAFVGHLDDGGHVTMDAEGSPAESRDHDGAASLAHALCRMMLASGTVLTVADAALSVPPAADARSGSFIGMPLGDEGSVTGVLCFSSVAPRPGGFDQTDLEFLHRLARLVEVTRAQWDTIRRLGESRAQFAGIIESAMDAIITHDEEQRIVIFNAAAEKVFGCSAADAVGKSLDRFLPERVREVHRRHVEKFARSGHTHRAMGSATRVIGARCSGEEFPCEAAISRVVVEGRQLLTVILRDVTERERAERSQQALEVKAQQVQKMDALGTLAGGIAHDFNNVLAVISMNADLALDDELSPTARESVDAIAAASNRARDLVRRILTFSRRQAVERAPLSLQSTVEDALAFLRATLPAGIALVARLDRNVPLVVADRTEMYQLVINLCTNAWHAIGDRSGRIEVELSESVVAPGSGDGTRSGLAPGRYARLTFTDTGDGMDAETLRRLFEPFYTTKEAGKGSGLGLSVVHGVVTELGGSVTVESEQGHGAKFTVMLPVATGAHAATRSSQPPRGQKASKRPLLLVLDDEALIVRAASITLRRAGFEVAAFTHPDEALAAVSEGLAISAAIVDLNMPQLNGIEFARALARLGCGVPILLMSGNLTKAQHEEAERVGVRHFLAKPYGAAQLRATVADLLASPPEGAKRT
jgi:two-component system, cell cycle sensor histidine kinase and response regulator CckA